MHSDSINQWSVLMADHSLFWTTLAVLISSAGVFLLWHAWTDGQRKIFWSGLILCMGSLPIWSLIYGPEFGTVYGLITISITAWICCIWQMDNKQGRLPPKPMADVVRTSSKKKQLVWWKAVFVHLVVIGFSSLFQIILFIRLLPVSSGNQMAMATLLFPLLWAVQSVGFSYSQRVLRNSLITSGIAVSCAVVIFL